MIILIELVGTFTHLLCILVEPNILKLHSHRDIVILLCVVKLLVLLIF